MIKKMKENIVVWSQSESTPMEKILVTVCALLAGMVIGFLLSPVKHGVTMASNNGSNNDIDTINGTKEDTGKSGRKCHGKGVTEEKVCG